MKKICYSLLAVIMVTIWLTGCAAPQTQTKQPVPADVTAAIKDACEFPEMIALTEKSFTNILQIDMEMVESFSALECSSGATADEAVVIKVKGSDSKTLAANKKEIEQKLKSRVADQIESFTGYVEAEVPKLNKSVVKINGDYILLIVATDTKKGLDAAQALF